MNRLMSVFFSSTLTTYRLSGFYVTLNYIWGRKIFLRFPSSRATLSKCFGQESSSPRCSHISAALFLYCIKTYTAVKLKPDPCLDCKKGASLISVWCQHTHTHSQRICKCVNLYGWLYLCMYFMAIYLKNSGSKRIWRTSKILLIICLIWNPEKQRLHKTFV